MMDVNIMLKLATKVSNHVTHTIPTHSCVGVIVFDVQERVTRETSQNQLYSKI